MNQYIKVSWKAFALAGAFSVLSAFSAALADPGVALTQKAQAAITPDKALEMLKQGNARFVSGEAIKNDTLIGIEIFDQATEILASAPDISPVAAQIQAKVRVIAGMAKVPERRAELDQLLKEKIACIL